MRPLIKDCARGKPAEYQAFSLWGFHAIPEALSHLASLRRRRKWFQAKSVLIPQHCQRQPCPVIQRCAGAIELALWILLDYVGRLRSRARRESSDHQPPAPVRSIQSNPLPCGIKMTASIGQSENSAATTKSPLAIRER